MVRQSDPTQTQPRRLLLTPQALRSLPPAPAGGRVIYQDTHTRGLGLRVGADGRSWVFSYASPVTGKWRVLKLGDIDEMRDDPGTGKTVPISLSDRRDQASVLRGRVSAGVDPLEARRPSVATATFADLASDWLKSRAAAAWRPKTRLDIKRIVTKYFLAPPSGSSTPRRSQRATSTRC